MDATTPHPLLPPAYRFAWRGGNRFTLLVDGENFFPEMVATIAAARHAIFMELYLVESGRLTGRFIDALLAAVRRGVTVHLLFDHFGCRNLSASDRERLATGGARLCFHNPLRYAKRHHNLFRDHRKLLLVDDHTAFVGGFGLTDAFTPEVERPWRESVVRIEGPCVADWRQLFDATWHCWSDTPLPDAPPPDVPLRFDPGPPEPVAGRVAQTRGGLRSDVVRSLLQHVGGARRRVWLASAYFLPSWKLRRALRRAARRGVDVRLLLPGPHTDLPSVRHAGRRYYDRLLRHGIRIYEYQPRFHHQKVSLCDDWVSIGSANIDRWTLRWNLEANQEIDDPGFAAEVAAMLTADLGESREITRDAWRRRPWHRRLREWFWSWVARRLAR